MKNKKQIVILIFAIVLLIITYIIKIEADKDKHIIPYPPEYDISADGASSYYGYGEHFYSPYFTHLDVYSMKPNDTCIILPKFETYQQTTGYTCGACSSLMVLNHFGNLDYKEKEIAKIAETDTKVGVGPEGIVKFFEKIGWEVESSLEKNGKPTFEKMGDFQKWVQKNLSEGIPIIVGWIDWGGHWQVIIGYDTMGTEDHLGDDVLILADSYDTSDQWQDGYYIVSAERFFSMWQLRVFPKEYKQPWIIAKPQK